MKYVVVLKSIFWEDYRNRCAFFGNHRTEYGDLRYLETTQNYLRVQEKGWRDYDYDVRKRKMVVLGCDSPKTVFRKDMELFRNIGRVFKCDWEKQFIFDKKIES